MRLPLRRSRSPGLDQIISPEIRGDRFSRAIEAVAATEGLRHILEIGASAGDGSTAAFVAGILRNPDGPLLHCFEVSEPRFRAVKERYRHLPFVRCYHRSSVPVEAFPTESDVAEFYRTHRPRLRRPSLATMLSWRQQDVDYLLRHNLSSAGIRDLKKELGIDAFDAVLIDGSEFLGEAEMAEVYGSRFLLLDDTMSYKNHRNYLRLKSDPAYRLIDESRRLRNGYAVFTIR